MNKNLFLLMVGAAALTVGAGCTRIKPDEIGVRTVNFGMGKGIVPADCGPGYHRYLWPLDTWHRFPSTVQRIRFAKDESSGWAQQSEPIEITSADGDHVVMNAEVFFQIKEGNAHQVLQDSGSDERYKDVVRGLAQDAARVLFGRLHTEAFYTEKSREEVREEAVTQLKQKLEPRGITLVDLLVESVEFDPNYENLIRQKKIADQRVELEKAKSRAAEEQGKVAKVKAEPTAKVQKIDRETEAEISKRSTEIDLRIGGMRAEASKYAAQLKADADLYKSEHEAEGQKLLKAAEAEGTERLNAALVGEGGRNLVALEAVKRLNVVDVTFPSVGYDWFNPSEMAVRVGATGKAGDVSSSKPEKK